MASGAPGEVDLEGLGMAIVLGRSEEDLALLRRCIDAGVPYISTPGGLKGLMLALEEDIPDLQPTEHVTGQMKPALMV